MRICLNSRNTSTGRLVATKRVLRGIQVCVLACIGAVSIPADCMADEYDVAVYGGTPGGIAAAVAAGQSGHSVILIEPTERIGGLLTSGLSHTDFHSLESLSGAFLDFAQRVEQHYADEYGAGSPQVAESFHGTFAEPKVNWAVYRKMLAEHENIHVRRQLVLSSVDVQGTDERMRIVSATFTDPNDANVTYAAKVWIDATYEGDLMAASGVEWTSGRESSATYGESLAPPQADNQLQAYNFRFIMTRDPVNRVVVSAPQGYDRRDFVPVLDTLKWGGVQRVFDYPSRCIFKAHLPPLPGDKYDINDVSRGPVRLSLPGVNSEWPDGDAATRRRIFDEQLYDQVGLLYFLQNDEAVPAELRADAAQWGWCRDEFTETDHLPPQLYVREARRMVGEHIYTQADSEFAKGDVRAVLHTNSIAMADYGNNCHGTAHEGPRFGGKHTGEFYNPVPPYQIPYGVLLPKKMSNLLVPVAASSSHVGFCALRLEPVWTSLGQAAGHAASLAVEGSQAVQDVSTASLQGRLHADRSATIYFSDITPESPDFAAVQWWGTLGGFHGVLPAFSPPRPRGETLHGQYSKAAPGHAADLSRPLDDELAQRWRRLASAQGMDPSNFASDNIATRGDFIRQAYRTGHTPPPKPAAD